MPTNTAHAQQEKYTLLNYSVGESYTIGSTTTVCLVLNFTLHFVNGFGARMSLPLRGWVALLGCYYYSRYNKIEAS